MAKIPTVTNVDNGDDVDASWGDKVKLDIENLFIEKTIQSTVFATNKEIDLDDGAIQSMTLTGDTTLTIANQLLNRPFALVFKENASGGHNITFFTTIKWAYGLSPSPDKAVNAYNSYLFIPVESGAGWTYLGYILGEGFS